MDNTGTELALSLPAIQIPNFPDILPRWARENYEGAAEDFTTWMVAVQYASLPTSTDSTRTRMAQALANSLKATINLQEVIERAKVLQLWQAKKTGWYHLLPQKYETAKLFFQEMMTDAKKTEASDLEFLLEVLLPAAEYLQIPPENIVCMPAYFSKARASVPALREAWKAMDARYRSKLSIRKTHDGTFAWTCGGISNNSFVTREEALEDYQKNIYTILNEEDRYEFTRMLHKIIELIPQEEISVKKFEKEMYRIRGKVEEPEELASSLLILLPDNRELLIVRSPNPSMTKRIEHRIEELTTGPASVRDASYLSQEVREWFNYSVPLGTYCYDLKRKGFVVESTGVILPTPEGIQDLYRQQIAKAMPIIEQVFRRKLDSWDVPVYTLVSVGENVPRLVCNKFDVHFKTVEDELQFTLEALPAALQEMYAPTLDKALLQILPRDWHAELNIGLFPNEDAWGIYVTVRKMA